MNIIALECIFMYNDNAFDFVIDSFVNQFGILLLIGIQSIVFGYFYGVEKILPILNQNSTIKVGKTWVFIIKYFLPVVLIGM